MKLTVEKVIYGGDGLAKTTNSDHPLTVFVPFTLPGETVQVSLDSRTDRPANGTLDRVLISSADRIPPRCIHFGTCGGCHYQHAAYDAQLQIKRQILEETLDRAGLDLLPSIIIHAANPWEYRNRIRLRLSMHHGRIQLGYQRRATNEFLPVTMCPIASPLLWKGAEAVCSMDTTAARWFETVNEIELFCNQDQSCLQLTLFLRHQTTFDFRRLCNILKAKLPELAGAGTMVLEHAGRTRKTQRYRPEASWAADGLSYTVGEESYWVSRGSFFQVNRYMLEPLVELVAAGRSGKLAWDLYAGGGLFSRVLTKRFKDVVAVEAAAGDLMRSFRGKGRLAIDATTLAFLRHAVIQRDRPELIVVDPPRAGLGEEACSLLTRLRAPEIVYVSCDPVTLGRDLKQMVDSGYRLDALHLVDMFPQTYHQETVAVLNYPVR